MRTALAMGVVLFMSCQLSFNPELVYACATEQDCGGGGYGCFAGLCCRPSGDEICGDGRDNDCDGQTDEGFDLLRDPENCGACGATCDPATQQCKAGVCAVRPEFDCNDREDNDDDGAIDCADADCAFQSCGAGCVCRDAAPRETVCSDHQDNDGNGETDCADASCDGQVCTANTTQRCSSGECLCHGRPPMLEMGGLCGDGVDNDCDELTDCFEPECDGQRCSSDADLDCVCVGIRKTEGSCENRRDDDGDGLVDCRDVVDCPTGSPCTRSSGQRGSCQGNNVCN